MANKKHKVESKYKNPDVLIAKLKQQVAKLEEMQYPDYTWKDPSVLEMTDLKPGTLSGTKLNGTVLVRGHILEKTESLEKNGESIKIKCIGFATEGIK